MDRNTKIVFNKLENYHLNKQGYIDLSNVNVKDKNDLAEVCDIFRDPRIETFRVFYMKNNKIVGQESITSKIPNAVILFSKDKKYSNSVYRIYENMKSRIKRLNADGYYLAHNHATESAIASSADIALTQRISLHVNGFLGHIVLGNSNRYSIIEKDSWGKVIPNKEQILTKKTIESIENKLEEKTIYDVKITTRDELVALFQKIQRDEDYSTAILTDCKCNVRMILDIPNRMFNQSKESLNGYFKNIARTCGAVRVFIGTQTSKTYEQIQKHQEFGTIKDSICFDLENGKVCSYKSNDKIQKKDLFDENSDRFSEECNTFYKERTEKMENEKLTVLYKEVGKEPIVKVIDDTLEAKQELVGGLIEVVPYEESLIICNEEGKLLNLSPNVAFDYDYIAGDFFVVGDDYENAGFKSLTQDEIKKYTDDLKKRAIKCNTVEKENKVKKKDRER